MSFLLWSITRTHTPTVLISVLTAKNRTFKIVRNAIWSAGIISSEKYSAVWRISAIRSKKNRTAKVFNSELKTIQPFGTAEVFRTANSAFRNVLDFPTVTLLSRSTPLVVDVYFKGIALQMQRGVIQSKLSFFQCITTTTTLLRIRDLGRHATFVAWRSTVTAAM